MSFSSPLKKCYSNRDSQVEENERTNGRPNERAIIIIGIIRTTTTTARIHPFLPSNGNRRIERREGAQGKLKIVIGHSWRFFSLFPFLPILFYSVALARKRERVAVPNNKTITICVYWSLNKRRERENNSSCVCNNEGSRRARILSNGKTKKKKNKSAKVKRNIVNRMHTYTCIDR